MNILITGASGKMGGYVCRELMEAGHAITNYSRSLPHVAGIRHVEGSILDFDKLRSACQDQDAIIHLAGIPGPGRATAQDMYLFNFQGTVNALEAARQVNIGKFIYASSAAALGHCFQRKKMIPKYFPVDEEHPCEPQDEYGSSKYLAELLCKRYTDMYGMQTICLRLNFDLYLDLDGAATAIKSGFAITSTVEVMWSAYQKLLDEPDLPQPCPGPPLPCNNLWAVTDARDGAQAFRLALENRDLEHEVFQINGDDTFSWVETPELLSRYYPDVPLRHELSDFESLVSNQKAKRLLGFKPLYTWRRSEFMDWLSSRDAVILR